MSTQFASVSRQPIRARAVMGGASVRCMSRRKQVSNPNGNIYVELTMTVSINNFGSPSDKAQIGWQMGALGRAETAGRANGDL